MVSIHVIRNRAVARSLAACLLALAATVGAALAAPGEVADVRLDDPSNIRWDLLIGAKGYNVYQTSLPQLAAGDYGRCHVGSHRTNSLTDLDIPSLQPLLIFYVTGFDETGEGSGGLDPSGAGRTFSDPCVPARRHFDLTANGDTGDGVLDGVEPARNPAFNRYATSRETTGVSLHSGEFSVAAVDLSAASRRFIPGGGPDVVGVGTNASTTLGSPTGPGIQQGRGPGSVRGGTAKMTGSRIQGPERHTKRVSTSSFVLARILRLVTGNGSGGSFASIRHVPGLGDPQGPDATSVMSLSETILLQGEDVSGTIVPRGAGGVGLKLSGDVPRWFNGLVSRFLAGDENSDGRRNYYARAGNDVLRRYRSQIRYNGPLGHGWDHVANARIRMVLGDVVCHDGAGRADLFLRDTPTTFISPPGIYSILIENPDGSYTKRDPDGTLHNFHAFDGSNLEGSLESVEDRNGNLVSLLYDHQGLLTTVVDTLGRSSDYEYDDAGRITAVTDFAGRRVEYGYDANGDLVTVRSPVVTGTPNGNDFPSGKVTTYQYSSGLPDPRSNHNLTGVIRPNDGPGGPPVVQLTYGETPGGADFDRVTMQAIGGDDGGGMVGGTLTYAYESLNPGFPPDPVTLRRRATVVDRNGNQSMTEHNWAGQMLSHTAFTNRDLRPGEPDYTRTNMFSSEGELLETVLPMGNRLQFTYDSASPNRGNQGNVLEVRAIPDNPAATPGRGDGHGGSLADRVWTFTWDDYFNGPLSMTEPRGNDPAYLPQNGGPQSAARYTSTIVYDHQEGNPDTNGVNALGTRFGILPCITPLDLGDQNGDGIIGQAGGNLVRLELPAVQLDPLSLQAGIEGDTTQEVVSLVRWNDLGQPIATVDPEGNLHEFEYYPENDPDGDGTPSASPADGRSLDPLTGGYLKTFRVDTTGGAGRNNGTDPTPANVQVDYQYDEVGNVTGVVDGRGVLTRITVNSLNQVVQVMTAAATADAAAAGESPTGRGEPGLTPEAFLTRFHYDANDNLTQAEVEDRGETRGLGPFISTDYTYDPLDRLRTVARETAPAESLVTQFDYDANGNLVQVTQPEGNAHQFAYDERDLPLTRTTGASGPRGGTPSVHKYAYDGNGNLTQYNDALDGQVDYACDGFDRLAVTTDRIGNTTALFYDPAGSVVRRLARGPIGGPTPADRSGNTNVDLAETFFSYDELGRLFRRDRKLFVPAGVTPALTPILDEGPIGPGDPRLDSSDGLITQLYEYDRLSRLSFSVRDSGATTRRDHDGAGRLLMVTAPLGAEILGYAWDGMSNLVETKETESPTGGGVGLPSEFFLTTAFYDALGRPAMSVDNLGQTSRVAYDSLGAATMVSDPRGPLTGGSITRRSPGHTSDSVEVNENGNVTRFTYDGAGRWLTTERILTTSGEGDGTLNPTPDDTNDVNPDGLLTASTVWDGNSLPQETTDDRGNRTTHAYDNLNRLTVVTSDDETETTRSYDPQGNVVALADANGSQFASMHDAGHRLVQIDITPATGVGGTTEQTYEYDGLGRMTRATDDNDPATTDDDVTTMMLYDSLSRRFEEGQQVGAGAGASLLQTGFGWLADGLQSDRLYPDGRQIAATYDGAGRLVLVDDLDPTTTEAASFEYFGLDRVHTRDYIGGPRSTMLDGAGSADIGFDEAKRIIALNHTDAATGGLHAGFDQSFDRAGNRTSQRRPHHPIGAGTARTESYRYDSAGRLVEFQEGEAGADHAISQPPDDIKTWQLDGTHRWAGMSRIGTDYGATPNNRNLYDEDWSGGMTTDDGVADDFLDDLGTPEADGLNFAHDENGNRTMDGRHAVSYDALNRMIGAVRESDGGLVGAYTYDAFGRRVTRFAEIGPGVTENRRYLYAGAAVIEERDPATGSVVRQIVHGPGGPLWQRSAAGTSHYYLEDPAGNIAALFAPGGAGGGAVVERVTYDPYGKPQFESAGNAPLLDAARNFVATSGHGNTVLWQGRWYDPETGVRTDAVNTDWGGLYLGLGNAMGIEPIPFRGAGYRSGNEPPPNPWDPTSYRPGNEPPPNPWDPTDYRPGNEPPPNPWDPTDYRPGNEPPPNPWDPRSYRSGNEPPPNPWDPTSYRPGNEPPPNPWDPTNYRPGNEPPPNPWDPTSYRPGNEPPPNPWRSGSIRMGIDPTPFRAYDPNTGRAINSLSTLSENGHDTLKAIINNMKP